MDHTTAVAELKAHLSQYLRRVKAGEEIVVTERGLPVARLVPISPAPALESLRDLERQGIVRLGSGKLPRSFWKLRRPADPEGSVRRALLQERDEGR